MLKRLFSNKHTNLYIARPLYQRSFSSAAKVDLKPLENNENQIEDPFVASGITFVQANPLLRQVFERSTSDGFFPRIKKDEEYLVFEPEFTKVEFQELLKKGQHDKIHSIINKIDEETDQRSIQILASTLYDQKLEFMIALDQVLSPSQMTT